MILWNTKKLAHKLSSGEITDKEKINYLILEAVLLSFIFIFLTPGGSAKDAGKFLAFDYIEFVVAIVMAFVFYPLYIDKNNSGDGENIVERIICLSWPVLIQVMVYSVPVIILTMIMINVLGYEQLEDFILFVFSIVTSFIIYNSLGYWIEYTAKLGKAKTESEAKVEAT